MKNIHRIYSWLAFPVIATVYIATLVIELFYNLLSGFTHENFYNEVPPPPPVPQIQDRYYPAFEYAYRMVVVLTSPFLVFIVGLKEISNYKF